MREGSGLVDRVFPTYEWHEKRCRDKLARMELGWILTAETSNLIFFIVEESEKGMTWSD